jgi:hypothetical protein
MPFKSIEEYESVLLPTHNCFICCDLVNNNEPFSPHIVLYVSDINATYATNVPSEIDGIPIRGRGKNNTADYVRAMTNADAIYFAQMLYETRESLFKTSNHVVGVTIGFKIIRGFIDYTTPCIQVFVDQKLPLTHLNPNEIIPQSIQGVVVDVEQRPKNHLLVGTREQSADIVASYEMLCNLERTDRNVKLCLGDWIFSSDSSRNNFGSLGFFAKRNYDQTIG